MARDHTDKLTLAAVLGAMGPGLLAALAGCGLFGAFSALVLKPQYTSSSMLYVLSKETTLTSLADLQIGTQLTNDYQVLVSSRPVLDVVIEELGEDEDIQFVDEDDVEDLDDFEYEEDWDEEEPRQ